MNLKTLVVGLCVATTVAVASQAVRNHGACGPSMAIAGGASCAADAAGAKVAGKRVGNDPAMTAICQKACATQIAFKDADVVAQPGVRRGDLTRCPVSGVVFKVGFTHPTIGYRGGSYRFCCSMCSKQFKARPARFVS